MIRSGGENSQPKCRRQVVSPMALLLTVFQLAVAQSHITQANDAALATLVKSVVTHELSDCLLVVMWDAAMKGSSVVAIVTSFPNVKQVVEVGARADSGLEGVVWDWGGLCRAYLLLLADPAPLLHQASKAPHNHWDYRGRWVIVGLKRDQLETLSLTTKGRKTEHLVGVIKAEDDSGRYELLHNLIYNDRILEGVLPYQSHSVLYSTTIYPDIHIIDGFSSNNNNSVNHKVMGHYSSPHNVITSVHLQGTLFPEKTRDLKGITLTVVVINIPPNILLRNNVAEGLEDRYFGLDVQVVRALAGLFNFTLQYIEPPSDELWGRQLENGSWNGLVGLLGRGEGDIGIGDLYVTSLGGRQEFQEYTAPYDNEEPCFLIRRERELPRWQSLALPFTLSTWLSVIVGLVLGGPVLYCLSSPSLPSENNLCGRSVIYVTLYTVGIHFRSPQHTVPTSATLQVLVVFMWVYVIVLTVGYSTNLTAFLTVARSPPGVNTLLQLYQSSLTIFGLGPFFGNVMAASTISHIRGLSQQFSPVSSFGEVDREMTEGQSVIIQGRKFLQFYIAQNTDLQGAPQYRIIEECFMPFSVALGLQSHSPLKRNMDTAVTWVLESGLVNHWFLESIRHYKMYQAEITGGSGSQRSTENEVGSEAVMEAKNREDKHSISLTVEHVQGVFYILCMGYVTSFLVLLAETCVYKATFSLLPESIIRKVYTRDT